jgi:hypothetical protein
MISHQDFPSISAQKAVIAAVMSSLSTVEEAPAASRSVGATLDKSN